MKHLFVPYELVLKLKEKGFDEDCMARYDKINPTNSSVDESNRKFEMFVLAEHNEPLSWTICTAPLYQQVIDWFREKHKLHFSVKYSHDHNKYSCEVFDEFHADELRKRNPRSDGRFPYPYKSVCIPHYWDHSTYYEALTKVIEEALKLI